MSTSRSRRQGSWFGEIVLLIFLAAIALGVIDAIWHPLVYVAAVILVAVGALALLTGIFGTPRDGQVARIGGTLLLVGLASFSAFNQSGSSPGASRRASNTVTTSISTPAHRRHHAGRSPGHRPHSRPRHHHPAAATTLALVATRSTGCHAHGLLPDPACTPGAIFTAATVSQICSSGYSERARNVDETTKEQVYAAYGITSHSTGKYEVDHLIPLEAGGSNAVANLWPERSYSGKDELENTVHDDICSGALPLRRAQRQIAHDWVALARRDGITPTNTPTPPPSPAPSSSPPPSSSAQTGDRNCSDFSTHAEAQQYFDSHGGSASNDFNGLDGNHDGVACSSLP